MLWRLCAAMTRPHCTLHLPGPDYGATDQPRHHRSQREMSNWWHGPPLSHQAPAPVLSVHSARRPSLGLDSSQAFQATHWVCWPDIADVSWDWDLVRNPHSVWDWRGGEWPLVVTLALWPQTLCQDWDHPAPETSSGWLTPALTTDTRHRALAGHWISADSQQSQKVLIDLETVS